MLNLKTGKHFAGPSAREQMTRREFGKGLAAIIGAGVAPSIALSAASLAGSANASAARGMMRNVGARNAAMFGEKKPYDYEVEYLQSTGIENQYFVLPFINGCIPRNYSIDLDYISVSDIGNRSYVFGCMRQGYNVVWRYHHAQRMSGVCFSSIFSNVPEEPTRSPALSWTNIKSVIVNGINNFYLRDVLLASQSLDVESNLTSPFILFGCSVMPSYYSQDYSVQPSSVKIKTRFHVNGQQHKTVVRDGIGEIYNTETGEFLERHGTFLFPQV